MSSSSLRGMRRKKTLGDVKVAVIGSEGVGKSALTVRFLTKRYIGEYAHQNENRYKHEMVLDGEPLNFEILDTCPKRGSEVVSAETLEWADGLILVYSVTDRESFDYIKRVKHHLCEQRNPNTLSVAPSNSNMPPGFREGGLNFPYPTLLVANKMDMVHLRQVSTEEGKNTLSNGEILAKDLDCSFEEVAAAEQVSQVAEIFHQVCREVQAARRKSKQSLLDRVLGNKTKVYARGKSDSALPKDALHNH